MTKYFVFPILALAGSLLLALGLYHHAEARGAADRRAELAQLDATAGQPQVGIPALDAPAEGPPSAAAPDPISHPQDAYWAARQAYERVGAWFAVLLGLFMLTSAIARRGLWGLGAGRRAAYAAGVVSVLGAAVDAGAGAGTWIAVLSTAATALALILSPTPPAPGGAA